MSEHFNKLAPDEAERLALLSEECGEVIQAVGKIQRHGYESQHPGREDMSTNRAMLEQELGDILAVTYMMFGAKDIDVNNVTEARNRKLKKVQKYLHHNVVDLSYPQTQENDVATACKVVFKALRDDPIHWESWKASIARAFQGEWDKHRGEIVNDWNSLKQTIANQAAQDFLELLTTEKQNG
jgi:NTP pyrophosphatase (non-canonical NTP hydrolase)